MVGFSPMNYYGPTFQGAGGADARGGAGMRGGGSFDSMMCDDRYSFSGVPQSGHTKDLKRGIRDDEDKLEGAKEKRQNAQDGIDATKESIDDLKEKRKDIEKQEKFLKRGLIPMPGEKKMLEKLKHQKESLDQKIEKKEAHLSNLEGDVKDADEEISGLKDGLRDKYEELGDSRMNDLQQSQHQSMIGQLLSSLLGVGAGMLGGGLLMQMLQGNQNGGMSMRF